MRNRILAGLGVAALAAVGVAAPANAISDSSADLYVVHAFPGLTVDVYVNDGEEPALANFEPMDVAGPLDLPAATTTSRSSPPVATRRSPTRSRSSSTRLSRPTPATRPSRTRSRTARRFSRPS